MESKQTLLSKSGFFVVFVTFHNFELTYLCNSFYNDYEGVSFNPVLGKGI
jgi:hypothetical protein